MTTPKPHKTNGLTHMLTQSLFPTLSQYSRSFNKRRPQLSCNNNNNFLNIWICNKKKRVFSQSSHHHRFPHHKQEINIEIWIYQTQAYRNHMQACKPHKVLHHFPCASLSCWFILNLNNITKFLMQWKNKRNCSTLVKSIYLPINNTSQLQNQKHHIKPITKIQRLNKFNNKTKEPPSLFENSHIIIIVHCTLVQIVLPLCWMIKNKRWQTSPS
jgi:hypothetical protein